MTLRISRMQRWPHELAHRTSWKKDQAKINHLPFYRAQVEGLVYRAQVEGLAPDKGAVVLASDLQGREQAPGERLLGEAVADELQLLQSVGELGAIRLIVLAGDLYDYPDLRKRGGTGTVDAVWRAFAGLAPVVGVMGNHDILDEPEQLPPLGRVLDGSVTEMAGLRVGGVSGIVGNTKRNQRKSEQAFMRALDQVVAGLPNLLVLHQGPDDPVRGQRGDPVVCSVLENRFRGMTVFGHCHWEKPFLVELGKGQAINVDGRVVVCEGI